MTLIPDTLRKLLCERLCEDVRVERRPDGAMMLRTHFQFPDGDRYPIHLSETASGGLRLSDRGHTLMHISYEHNIDMFMDGTRGMLLERIMNESGLQWDKDGGALCFDTAPDRLPEAIFRFGQALTKVYDLTFLSRSNVGSTFYDDLEDLLSHLVDETRIQRDYEPEAPNAQAYPVDYRGISHCSCMAFGNDYAVSRANSGSSRSSFLKINPRFPEWTSPDSRMSVGI